MYILHKVRKFEPKALRSFGVTTKKFRKVTNLYSQRKNRVKLFKKKRTIFEIVMSTSFKSNVLAKLDANYLEL